MLDMLEYYKAQKLVLSSMTADLIFHHKHKISWIHYQIHRQNHLWFCWLLFPSLVASLTSSLGHWFVLLPSSPEAVDLKTGGKLCLFNTCSVDDLEGNKLCENLVHVATSTLKLALTNRRKFLETVTSIELRTTANV